MKSKFPAVYKLIYDEVARVPEGTVATYGQIADRVGCGPRQVGRALSELPPHSKCPWHRVINSKGTISIRSGNHVAHYDQEALLQDEGIEMTNGKVDLKVYRWEA